ncbi:MAG: DEAD/DEAH box helicase [Chloroflexota bacterium]|nr:DEAD/DEAH box helicase [Chloroflexota bacterium]
MVNRLPAPKLIEELKMAYNGRSGTVRADGTFDQTLIYIKRLEACEAVFGELDYPLPPLLEAALTLRGITRLYAHQTTAINALRAGQNVALVTATASGKTLAFNLPILEKILDKPSTRALYLFPTNALMNDQLATLTALLEDMGSTGQEIRAFKYNGSMGEEEKRAVRHAQPNILLTNPELVHLSLTGWHRSWVSFLQNLRYIVIDEVHTYRGVFGSHLAHLLRRLRRVCAYYGANPQIICCSATIGNPVELVQNLTGLTNFTAITNDGARKNERYFVIWRPPTFTDRRDEPATRSYLEETVDLFQRLTGSGYSTLCFSRLRRYAENMYRMCHDQSTARQMQHIMVYRAGLRPEERHQIERGLKDGTVEGVFSTNALELGIDIGGLDAVIIAGYPGSQMAVWQQAGRAGRGGKDAVVFLIASQNPIDQYFVANPTDLFTRQAESALLNVGNENIARQHLMCAALELPLTGADFRAYYPSSLGSLVQDMVTKGELVREGRHWGYDRGELPHGRVSLRTSTTRKYTITNRQTGREIGVIEPPNLYKETHPGAIYTHSGETFRVDAIDEVAHKVLVFPVGTNHITSSVSRVQIKVDKEGHQQREIHFGEGKLTLELSLGYGSVTEEIYGYREVPLVQRKRNVPDVVKLEQPLTYQMRTELLWLVLPPREAFGKQFTGFDSGLHGLEHLLLGLFPLEVMCDPQDIGSASYGSDLEHQTRPTIYFFDSFEGGAGFTHGCYPRFEDLLHLAARTLASCRCKEGCPACVQSARCREVSVSVSKEATSAILHHLLSQD